MTIKRYRKKPVVVEAMKVTYENIDEVVRWCDGEVTVPTGIHIPTLEGVMLADMGDYVIRGIEGEFYPVKPGIFAATYEELT